MRKLTLSLVLMLLLASCGTTHSVTPDTSPLPTPTVTPEKSPIPTPSTSPEESPIPTETSGESYHPPLPLPELPVIDGSTSTITLHTALRWALTKEWVDIPEHNQTYGALERLIPGSENPADVVLAVKYYDETLQDAQNRGAELVITPIAKEGFVFIVQKDNPIESLTQQQLRDIFSGNVTNWKEVGGKDEEIITVLRNHDSGSQTALLDFMEDLPLTEDDDTLYADMMSTMLSITAEHPNAIGYNIYSWSLAQTLVWNDLKALAVDDVMPTNETLSNDSYPLRVYTYSYYNEGNVKGKALTDWLLTAEGQKIIAEAGYVGMYGDLPPNDGREFFDWGDSRYAARIYIRENTEFPETDNAKLIEDPALLAGLAGGKEKDVTVGWVFNYSENGLDPYDTYYVILTREQGGLFEVIAEGNGDPRLEAAS